MKCQQCSKPKPTLSHTVSDLTHRQLRPEPYRVQPAYPQTGERLSYQLQIYSAKQQKPDQTLVFKPGFGFF